MRVYYVKWFDELVGTIEFPSCIFTKCNSYNKMLPLSLGGFDCSTLTPSEVRKFLESRVPVETNKSVRRMINKSNYSDEGLDEILLKTLGMKPNDFIWIVTKENLHLDFNLCHASRNQFMWSSLYDLYKK